MPLILDRLDQMLADAMLGRHFLDQFMFPRRPVSPQGIGQMMRIRPGIDAALAADRHE